MEIRLTKQETEQYFYNALCNGLSYLGDYGLKLLYDERDYDTARDNLKQQVQETVCYEDVLMEILRSGGKLTLVDYLEGIEDDAVISLNDVHERVAQTPLPHLLKM